jgi:hypothetical protein
MPAPCCLLGSLVILFCMKYIPLSVILFPTRRLLCLLSYARCANTRRLSLCLILRPHASWMHHRCPRARKARGLVHPCNASSPHQTRLCPSLCLILRPHAPWTHHRRPRARKALGLVHLCNASSPYQTFALCMILRPHAPWTHHRRPRACKALGLVHLCNALSPYQNQLWHAHTHRPCLSWLNSLSCTN